MCSEKHRLLVGSLRYKGFMRFIVEMDCSCRYWELTGLPCCHALACIIHCREDYTKFVDVFYYNSNWQACYKFGLQGENDWPQVNEPPVLPPLYQKQPGRPKKVSKRRLDLLTT